MALNSLMMEVYTGNNFHFSFKASLKNVMTVSAIFLDDVTPSLIYSFNEYSLSTYFVLNVILGVQDIL